MLLHTRRVALVALALLAAACSADRSPTAAPPAVPARLSLTAAEEQQLQETLAAERARIEVARGLNGVTYAALSPVYRTASPLTGLLGLPLLSCAPLPYAADVKIIGPEGGQLAVGPHVLNIPAGALAKPMVITGEAPVGLTTTVKFAPHGLTFERPAKLAMDYRHCRVPLGSAPTVVYVDGQLNILEWVQSRVLGGGLVGGDLWHFSSYAIGRRSIYSTSW